MEISFLKIKQTPVDINYKKDKNSIIGTLKRVNRDSVKLDSILKAELNFICNRCGKEWSKEIEYPLELILSDGRYNSKDEIDVIEFFNGVIDFDYIINSEIISIEDGYNFCEDCIDNDEILEIEF